MKVQGKVRVNYMLDAIEALPEFRCPKCQVSYSVISWFSPSEHYVDLSPQYWINYCPFCGYKEEYKE